MQNEATATLEGRVTRVPIWLRAVVRDFFRGLKRGDSPVSRAETIRDSRSSSLQLFTKRTQRSRAVRLFAGNRSVSEGIRLNPTFENFVRNEAMPRGKDR